MAFANKKRGFRQIEHAGQKFNWRFADKVDIRPELQKNNKLLVDIGWKDPWLNSEASRDTVTSITPAFIAKAIEFALRNKWDIEEKSSLLELNYKNGKFGLVARVD